MNTESADLEVIRHGLERLYARSGSGRARIDDLQLLGSGFETDVFAFSAVNEEDPEGIRDLILRVYGGDGAAKKAAHEFAVMTRLRDLGYPVPFVESFSADGSVLDRPLVVMERLHATSLGERYWSGSEGARREAEALLYPLMSRLHALPASEVLLDDPIATDPDPYGFANRELGTLTELLGGLEGTEPPSLRAALDWLAVNRAVAPCERFVVIHRDFHPNNVLVSERGPAFVIDWSNATAGDCRADLAWTRLILRSEEEPDRGARSLELYEQASGRAVARLDYFEVAACLRLLLSTLVSLRHGSARQGMRPVAETLMRQGADHMRYAAALLEKRVGIPMPDVEPSLAALLVGE